MVSSLGLRWLCSVLYLAVIGLSFDTPAGVHIALAGLDRNGVSNSMSVVWTTSEYTKTSTVMYGLAPGEYDGLAHGSSTTLWSEGGYSHVVVLPALEPSTEYYYVCGDATEGYSNMFSFTTAPEKDVRVKFAVLGDMGTIHSEPSMELLKTLEPDVDLYVNIGDVGYPDIAAELNSTFEDVWKDFMHRTEPFAAMKPHMVLPGNHESECRDASCAEFYHTLSNFTAFNQRYRMPAPESGGVLNMWYSFNYGPVHFVMINTETDYPGAPLDEQVGKSGGFGDQMAWLEADLANAASPSERHRRPWIVVAGHRPIYSARSCSSDFHPTSDALILQKLLEPLFHKYSVDMYFAGHVHAYERQYPVYNTTEVEHTYMNPSHTVHIISGNAGNFEQTMEMKHPDAPWSAVTSSGYGVGTLEVVSRTTLRWTAFFSGAPEDGVPAGTVMDDVMIVKDRYEV